MIATLRSAGMLRRHWKLAAVSVFSLSIAMALGVLGLSVSNTFVLLAPAVPAPDRLLTLYTHSPSTAIDQVSYPDYEYYRERNHVFTDVAAAPNSIGLLDDFNFEGRDVKIMTRPVSENYFAVMAIRPFLGRLFSRGDDEAKTQVAVMTWACWKRLGSDPKIVGKVLANHTIIGVTPKEFTGSFYGLNGDLFTTLREVDGDRSWLTKRGVRRLFLAGRLKPGISQQQAQAEMTTLSSQLSSAYPEDDKSRTAVITRSSLLPPDQLASAEWMSAILMVLVLLVLFIACTNVANLLLAVAIGRSQEAAIKLALGAPRGRLIREFLTESIILCGASGALGYSIAAALATRYSNFTFAFPMFGAFSVGLNLRFDAPVIAFTLALVVAATLATGLSPALYASSPNLALILSGETAVGGTRKRVRRNKLVILQVAVCTLVLAGMGLCQRNLYNLRHVDMGFSTRNLMAVTVYAEAEGYPEPRAKELYQTLRRSIAAVPGVESVTLAWDLPLSGGNEIPVVLPNGVDKISVAHTAVDTNYFATLTLPLLAGRAFNSGDREASPPVVVVNRQLADMFWPGQDPIGRVIVAGEQPRKFTVVGVAANGKYDDLDESPRPFLYYALPQHYRSGIDVIARTAGDPRRSVEPFAQALRALGLRIMIQPVTFENWMNLALLTQRIAAGIIGVLSGLGLLLAVVGLFGAISYSVSERRKELGIRVALGARPGQLLQMLLREIVLTSGAGVAIGTLLGIGATIVFRSQLYGVSALEWIVLLPVGALMLALSLLVAYLSARPWLTIDPMEAVRHA